LAVDLKGQAPSAAYRPELPETMGRKTVERTTVTIRTYADFSEIVQRTAGERRMTAASFGERFLTSCVERAHRDYIKSESKRLSEGERGIDPLATSQNCLYARLSDSCPYRPANLDPTGAS
jgi:hypothetical protein